MTLKTKDRFWFLPNVVNLASKQSDRHGKVGVKESQ